MSAINGSSTNKAFIMEDEDVNFRHRVPASDDVNKKSVTLPQVRRTATGSCQHMLYKVEDIPPIFTSFVLGFQHYLMAMGGIVGVPLILAEAMCMFETEEGLKARAMIIGSMMFVSGISTFMQTTFGIRLPILQGTSSIFLMPAFVILSLPHNVCPSPLPEYENVTTGVILYNDTDGEIVDGTLLWKRRIREIQGSIAVASLAQLGIGLSGGIGLLTKYVSPITVTTALLMIGLSLFKVASDFSQSQWGIAILTAVIIIVCSRYLQNIDVPFPSITNKKMTCQNKIKLFQLLPVLIAIMITWFLSFILTVSGVYTDDKNNLQYQARTDYRLNVLYTTQWFRFPYPFQWGIPRVTPAGVAGMVAACIGGIMESIGDYYATSRMSGAPIPPAHAMNRGVAMEGLACILNGLIGTGGATTSYSQNSAAISVTRVGSRRVMQAAGILMIFLGIFGKFGSVLVMIPDCVLGGVFMVIFGMIASVGLSNLAYVDLSSSRNTFVLGFSVFMGLMVPEYIKVNQNIISTGSAQIDQIFIILLGNSMLIGGGLAFFLDVTLPGEKCLSMSEINQGFEEENTDDNARINQVYNLPFSTNFRFAKYIPILPEFQKKEQLEINNTTVKNVSGTEL